MLSPETGRPVQAGLLGRRRRHDGGSCGAGGTRRSGGDGKIFLGLPPPSWQRGVPVQRLDHVVRTDQLLDRRDFRLFGRRVQIGLFRFGPRRTVPARLEVERRRHAVGQFGRTVCRRPTPRGRGRPVTARGDRVTGQRGRPSSLDFGRAERAQRTFARIVTARRQARVAGRGRRHVQTAVAASAAARGFVDVQVQRDRSTPSFLLGASPAAVHGRNKGF